MSYIRNGRDFTIGEEVTIYKLTDRNMQTRNTFQWCLGETYRTSGQGPIYGPGHLHVYSSAPLALLMAPIHVSFSPMRLFIGHGIVSANDRGTKLGCREVMLTRELAIPDVQLSHRIAFGILAAWEVTTDTAWRQWARAWLSGNDRTRQSAHAAADAAAHAAAYTDADAAYTAADAAADAAATVHAASILNLDMIAAQALGIVPLDVTP